MGSRLPVQSIEKRVSQLSRLTQRRSGRSPRPMVGSIKQCAIRPSARLSVSCRHSSKSVRFGLQLPDNTNRKKPSTGSGTHWSSYSTNIRPPEVIDTDGGDDRFVSKKGSPYSTAERRVQEMIPVLGSQPAGDVSHKPGGRLPLLSARPAVTLATLNRAATSFAAW